MKLAVIGSTPLLDKPVNQEMILREIEQFNPTVLILVPNKRFNAVVKAFAKEKGYLVDELKPARPSWLGKDTQSRRKALLRNLYANYVSNRADQVLLIFDIDAAGLTGKAIKEYTISAGIPTKELFVIK